MERKTIGAALAALALGSMPAPAADAQSQDPSKAALEQRVEELEQELELVKRKLEVDAETQAGKPAPAVVGAGTDGFFIKSADSAYQVKIRGYTQLDSRWFSHSDTTTLPDSFYFRRVRPIVEGTLAGFVDFRIMPDFANSTLVLQDAYANLRFAPELQLQAGKFKSPFGLERLESATNLWFVERALPTLLAPNRDLGVMLQGGVREGLISYQLAFLNGNNDTTTTDSDVGDDKDFVARLFVHPFQETSIEALQGLGVGFATTYGRPQGSPATIQSIGRQTLFAFQTGVTLQGERARYSPQAYWYWGPFAMLGEYVINSTGFQQGATTLRARASSWQIAAACVLTGENTSWRGVIPSRPFNIAAGDFGAFEVAARYSTLRLDSDLFTNNTFINAALYPESTKEWAFGVNWYLNRFIKVVLNYEHTEFSNADGNSNIPSEGALLTRLQLAY